MAEIRKIEECNQYFEKYDALAATPVEMRAYAECVAHVHGGVKATDNGLTALFLLGIVVGMAFVGLIWAGLGAIRS